MSGWKKSPSPYRFSFSGSRDQLRGALVPPLQSELARYRELLLERGVEVSYESIRKWCDRFGAQSARRAKAARGKPGSTWHFDEVWFCRNKDCDYHL